MEVMLFGETVLYRKAEVASDRHPALEERWEKGIWLGHARHTSEVLVGTSTGVVKSLVVRRLPDGQQWGGHRLRQIPGPPVNWRLDASDVLPAGGDRGQR